MGLLLLSAILALASPQDDGAAIKAKQAEITQFLKTAKTEREFRVALSDLSHLASRASEINEYDLSLKLYKQAERVARVALKDSELAKSFTESAKRSLDVGRKFKRAEKAYFRVEDGKASPADHLIVGKFICFVKGGWEVGLKSLAEGSDKKLKALADRDLYANESTEDKIALGDEWGEYSKKEPAAKERAIHWYAKAWPKTRGVSREQLRRKLYSFFVRPNGRVKEGPPKGWGVVLPAGKKPVALAVDESRSHSGKASFRIKHSDLGMLVTHPRPIEPGRKYVLSFWVMTEDTDKNGLMALAFFPAQGKETKFYPLFPVDSPWWTYVEIEAECPPDAVNFRLMFAQTNLYKGTVWLDGISLKDEFGREVVVNGDFEE